MRILWLLNQGAGNVVQTIPAYLCLCDKYGKENIDVRYMPKYPTDRIEKASFYPERPEYITEEMVSYYFFQHNKKKRDYYDYVVKPPFIYKPNGNFEAGYIDQMRELDSEVKRNLRIAEYLGAEAEVKKKIKLIRLEAGKPRECPVVVLHNGGLNAGGWLKKKYPWFPNLVERLKELDVEVVSIGGKDEYIEGTIDRTQAACYSLYEIMSCDYYIGTDSGPAHIAALLNKPGIILYTFTDPRKNWDEEFHKTLKVIKREDLECMPCQRGYHMIFGRECTDMPADCQLIPIDMIMEEFEKWLNTTRKNGDPTSTAT